MNKKIGIATIVSLNNYGAVLQSYALLKIINSLGYEAEIIDLREPNENDCNMFMKAKSFKDILRNLRKLQCYSAYKNRMILFDNFVKNYISLSPNYYLCNSLNIDERYDVLCTGSDQTFNILLNAFKKEYYLSFSNKLPKMSYASSFGENCNDFTEKQKKWIKENLLQYKYISIREKNGVELANSLTGRDDIIQTLDPTLLLSPKDWRKLINQSNNRRNGYILFYSVLSEPWVVKTVKDISRLTGMPVVAPHMQNQYEFGCYFKRVIECGPLEFLDLIAHADLVLTTSFHATVFSFQFERPFYSFLLKEGNRIGSFLDLVNLKNSSITEKQSIEKSYKINFELNYMKSKEILEIERKRSMDYLVNSLQKMNNMRL